ncbi:hypothetical protein [Caenispirillum salinarum]|uniref:hypothetical protein n=1 Tax=Caenispirillum salinarum TaxID=859058 RepID=UPI00384C0AAC
MIRATDIRKRLPALRRHAYLLTGSRTAADAVLAIAVARLPREDDGRPCAADGTEIHRAILDAAARVNCPPDAGLPPLMARLLGMDLMTRAVIVLTVVERLPPSEVAAVCDLSPEGMAAHLARGREALDMRPAPRVMNF